MDSCPNCGKQITSENLRQIYCDITCKYEAKKKRLRKTHSAKLCGSCGKEFTPFRSDALYCCAKCRVRAFRAGTGKPTPEPEAVTPKPTPITFDKACYILSAVCPKYLPKAKGKKFDYYRYLLANNVINFFSRRNRMENELFILMHVLPMAKHFGLKIATADRYIGNYFRSYYCPESASIKSVKDWRSAAADIAASDEAQAILMELYCITIETLREPLDRRFAEQEPEREINRRARKAKKAIKDAIIKAMQGSKFIEFKGLSIVDLEKRRKELKMQLQQAHPDKPSGDHALFIKLKKDKEKLEAAIKWKTM